MTKVLCDRYRKSRYKHFLSSSTFPGQSYWFKKVNTGSVSSSREESPGSWKERFRKVSNSRGISFRLCLKGMVYKDTVLKRKNSSSRNFPSSTREYRSLTDVTIRRRSSGWGEEPFPKGIKKPFFKILKSRRCSPGSAYCRLLISRVPPRAASSTPIFLCTPFSFFS